MICDSTPSHSNIHFGYIGRVSGFDTQFLIWGSELNTGFTGTNDDGDVILMAGGAALFENPIRRAISHGVDGHRQSTQRRETRR